MAPGELNVLNQKQEYEKALRENMDTLPALNCACYPNHQPVPISTIQPNQLKRKFAEESLTVYTSPCKKYIKETPKDDPLLNTLNVCQSSNKNNLIENQKDSGKFEEWIPKEDLLFFGKKNVFAENGEQKENIVNHQVLPSIYELQQIGNRRTTEKHEDDEYQDKGSMFYPLSSPSPPTSTLSTSPNGSNNKNNFIENLQKYAQKIECNENGKSYLQLGIIPVHHLPPVAPVIHPIPTSPGPTLQYRNQRSSVLRMSFHKLEMAKQNKRSESFLCRSVLICNTVRYIEEENDQELREQNLLNGDGEDFEDEEFLEFVENYVEPEESLKDFNSAFRQSPPPFSMDLGKNEECIQEEERGINWSSVLSLSHQSEDDPLNNNSLYDHKQGSQFSQIDLSQYMSEL